MCGYVHMSLVGVHRVQKRPSESLEPVSGVVSCFDLGVKS